MRKLTENEISSVSSCRLYLYECSEIYKIGITNDTKRRKIELDRKYRKTGKYILQFNFTRRLCVWMERQIKAEAYDLKFKSSRFNDEVIHALRKDILMIITEVWSSIPDEYPFYREERRKGYPI